MKKIIITPAMSEHNEHKIYSSEQILNWLETIMKNQFRQMDDSTSEYICSILSKEENLSVNHYNNIVAVFGRPCKSTSIFRPSIEEELHSLGSYLM
jgi:hypothetical protein